MSNNLVHDVEMWPPGMVMLMFNRACAVFGGTYVLGSDSILESIELDGESGVTMKLPCHPRPITAKHLITSPGHLPSSLVPNGDTASTGTRRTAHCIAILPSRPEVLLKPAVIKEESNEEDNEEAGEDDTAVIVFPPTEDEAAVVRALLMGEGTGSCPAGQCRLLSLSPRIIEFG